MHSTADANTCTHNNLTVIRNYIFVAQYCHYCQPNPHTSIVSPALNQRMSCGLR